MGKGIAVEVGIRHGHSQTEKYILDPIAEAGGRVEFIVTDNVFIKSQFRKDKKELYGWTHEQAVEKYAGRPLTNAAEVFGATRSWKDDLDRSGKPVRPERCRGGGGVRTVGAGTARREPDGRRMSPAGRDPRPAVPR